MKIVYPVILTPDDEMFIVNIPDFDIVTQGTDIANAIDMAKDAICITAIDMQDDNIPLPKATNIVGTDSEDKCIITLVEVDIGAYRKMLDTDLM